MLTKKDPTLRQEMNFNPRIHRPSNSCHLSAFWYQVHWWCNSTWANQGMAWIKYSIYSINDHTPHWMWRPHPCTSLLHALFLYTNLREAIRYEDGEQVVRQWKFWLIYFLGSSKKNYALEAVIMLSNIYANFPRHIIFIVTHNRFVNTSGKEGHGKPLDMMIKHHKLF